MKVRHIFYIQAIALLIASSIWLFAPAAFYKTGGLATTDPKWLLFGQNTGALLLGLFPIAFFAGRAADSPLRRELRLSFFILHFISLLVYAIAWFIFNVTFGDGMAIGLHIFFVFGFGYFQFLKPNA